MAGRVRTRTGEREADFAAHWAAGAWRGRQLQSLTGQRLTLVYQGRPGGGAGPDFRDAVLVGADGERLAGDVELHLRASDWRTHGHDADSHYDGLVLHVALRLGSAAAPHATPLASGRYAPLVILDDIRRTVSAGSPWPCAGLHGALTTEDQRAILLAAGMARFAERTQTLAGQLVTIGDAAHAPAQCGPWGGTERVLWLALAEALGYGRDRVALRTVGSTFLPDALPELDAGVFAQHLPRVERTRVVGLLAWRDRWHTAGPWQPLLLALQSGDARRAGRALIEELRVPGGAVSPGRAAIVVANVVLPFATAWAEAKGMATLAERTHAIYRALPGLPSNQITRAMTAQLGLGRLPTGAAAQLGLHHIWVHWCRTKSCANCPCNLHHDSPLSESAHVVSRDA